MIGPIQKLRWCGSLCPLFESNEEHAVRVADLMLKSVPIRWYRKVRVQPYAVGSDTLVAVTDDFTWCGGWGSSQKPAAVRKETKIPTMTQYVGIDASLDVIDTMKGPAFMVTSNKYTFVDDDDGEGSIQTKSGEKDDAQIMTKTILFKDAQLASRASLADWQALGFGKEMLKSGIIVYSTGKKKKVLVLQVMPGSKLSLSRDEAMKHLNTLISWDRIGPIEDGLADIDDDTDDEEDDAEDIGDQAMVAAQPQELVSVDQAPTDEHESKDMVPARAKDIVSAKTKERKSANDMVPAKSNVIVSATERKALVKQKSRALVPTEAQDSDQPDWDDSEIERSVRTRKVIGKYSKKVRALSPESSDRVVPMVILEID